MSKNLLLNKEERTVCEVWTRVMGYYRPVSAFNKGKHSEYKERRCFTENCEMPKLIKKAA
ncbi:MAG: hypothetical protein IJ481_02550 [Alphaproteobacteria bacterium]|nr:hypothetical protein [Alphaproteobacteria bacterium]